MDQKSVDNQRRLTAIALNEPGRPARVQARQRNHEDYRLPASLSHLPPMPLYLAVAHYVLLACAPVSRQAISAAFRISTRRALEVMRYLLNADVGVMCARLPPLPEVREQGHRIQVWAISVSGERRQLHDPAIVHTPTHHETEAPAAPVASVDKPRTRQEKERACQDMRRWFLQRPNVKP